MRQITNIMLEIRARTTTRRKLQAKKMRTTETKKTKAKTYDFPTCPYKGDEAKRLSKHQRKKQHSEKHGNGGKKGWKCEEPGCGQHIIKEAEIRRRNNYYLHSQATKRNMLTSNQTTKLDRRPPQEGRLQEDTYVYNNNINTIRNSKKWKCHHFQKSYEQHNMRNATQHARYHIIPRTGNSATNTWRERGGGTGNRTTRQKN